MSATHYRIGLSTGPVQGNGGLLEGSAGLKLLRAASAGGRAHFFEPTPGHARMYPGFSAEGNGPGIDVPYAGARITIFRVRPPRKRAEHVG